MSFILRCHAGQLLKANGCLSNGPGYQDILKTAYQQLGSFRDKLETKMLLCNGII